MCLCEPCLSVFDRVLSSEIRPQLPVVPVPFLSPGLVGAGRQHAHHSHAQQPTSRFNSSSTVEQKPPVARVDELSYFKCVSWRSEMKGAKGEMKKRC